MTRLQAIIEEAKLLSGSEREQLIEALKRQSISDRDDDVSVAQRGLAYLTDSSREEDWSAFYPESLRRKAGGLLQ